MNASLAAQALLALVVALGVTACSRYDAAPGEPLDVPPREGFSPVSGMMEARCGTLDCHGSPARNLRVYGVFGLRADGNSRTGSPDTTDAEIDATYDSVVTLDPEVLSAVYGGVRPAGDWIVLAKALGTRAHVGGARVAPGSAAHRCVLAWLTDGDTAVCAEDDLGPVPRDGETW